MSNFHERSQIPVTLEFCPEFQSIITETIRNKPFNYFLIDGPPGVGKSLLAEHLRQQIGLASGCLPTIIETDIALQPNSRRDTFSPWQSVVDAEKNYRLDCLVANLARYLYAQKLGEEKTVFADVFSFEQGGLIVPQKEVLITNAILIEGSLSLSSEVKGILALFGIDNLVTIVVDGSPGQRKKQVLSRATRRGLTPAQAELIFQYVHRPFWSVRRKAVYGQADFMAWSSPGKFTLTKLEH